MARRAFHCALAFVSVLLCTTALSGAVQPSRALDDVQRQKYEHLVPQIIAPCCWNETLDLHHSPAADELRNEIASALIAGKDAESIKNQLVAQHGSRILAMPGGLQGRLLVIAPWVALALGLTFVAFAIRRLRRRSTRRNDEAAELRVLDERLLDRRLLDEEFS